jgi:hypothetical protein
VLPRNTPSPFDPPTGLQGYGSEQQLTAEQAAFRGTQIIWNNRGETLTVGQALNQLQVGRFRSNSEYWKVVELVDRAGYSESQALGIAEEAMYASQQYPDLFPTWWDALAGLPVDPNRKGGPTSSTVRSVNISSQQEAYTLGEEAWIENLGRNMNKKEAKAFLAALNKMEEKNATTTFSTSSGGSNNFTTTRTEGGFNPQQWAQDYARSQEGYSERLIATKLMTAMDEFLSGGLRPSLPQLRGNE